MKTIKNLSVWIMRCYKSWTTEAVWNVIYIVFMMYLFAFIIFLNIMIHHILNS